MSALTATMREKQKLTKQSEGYVECILLGWHSDARRKLKDTSSCGYGLLGHWLHTSTIVKEKN